MESNIHHQQNAKILQFRLWGPEYEAQAKLLEGCNRAQQAEIKVT